VPVALPDSSLTFGDSLLSNFQASLTSFCVPLFGTLSLHSESFSESRVDTIQYAVFKGVFESFSFTKRKWSLVLRLGFRGTMAPVDDRLDEMCLGLGVVTSVAQCIYPKDLIVSGIDVQLRGQSFDIGVGEVIRFPTQWPQTARALFS
jgi:hypothetical protein